MYGSSCNSLFFWSRSLFFSFSIYFLASYPALGISLNRKRKQRGENEAEKGIITWTAVHRYSKIRTIRLTTVNRLMQTLRLLSKILKPSCIASLCLKMALLFSSANMAASVAVLQSDEKCPQSPLIPPKSLKKKPMVFWDSISMRNGILKLHSCLE